MERKEIMDWVADEVSDEMEYVWNKHREDYDFTACQDYAPYGDTYVGTGYYTDERKKNNVWTISQTDLMSTSSLMD